MVEPAVVVQLADCLPKLVPAVRVLGFDERAPIFYPGITVDRPDFTGGRYLLRRTVIPLAAM